MSKVEIATNYARALYSITKEAGTSEKVLRELSELRKSVEAMSNPLILTKEETEAVLSKIPFDKDLSNALKIMSANDRLSVVPELHEEFEALLDQEMNVARGTVISAEVLNTEQRKNIEDYVHKTTNKKVILSYKEDPSIIGGFIVNVGSMKMDGSLRNQISNMKNLFNNGAH